MTTESFAIIVRRSRWREMRNHIDNYTTLGWALLSITRAHGDAVIIFERKAA